MRLFGEFWVVRLGGSTGWPIRYPVSRNKSFAERLIYEISNSIVIAITARARRDLEPANAADIIYAFTLTYSALAPGTQLRGFDGAMGHKIA